MKCTVKILCWTGAVPCIIRKCDLFFCEQQRRRSSECLLSTYNVPNLGIAVVDTLDKSEVLIVSIMAYQR